MIADVFREDVVVQDLMLATKVAEDRDGTTRAIATECVGGIGNPAAESQRRCRWIQRWCLHSAVRPNGDLTCRVIVPCQSGADRARGYELVVRVKELFLVQRKGNESVGYASTINCITRRTHAVEKAVERAFVDESNIPDENFAELRRLGAP